MKFVLKLRENVRRSMEGKKDFQTCVRLNAGHQHALKEIAADLGLGVNVSDVLRGLVDMAVEEVKKEKGMRSDARRRT